MLLPDSTISSSSQDDFVSQGGHSSHLRALQTPHHNYCLLELDYTPKLAELLGLDVNMENNIQLLEEITQKLATVAQNHVTGLVLDPVYSFSAQLPSTTNNKPLTTNPKLLTTTIPATLLRLGYLATEVDPLALPILINNWGIENIKNNYATAKLEILYHPDEDKALEKKQLVAEVYDHCQYEKIPFLLKLVVYTPAEEEFNQVSFQEAQLTAVQEFRDTCDVLALQHPQDALASATLTAELDIPWLFVAEGASYDDYKEMLRTSLENGAKGFLVGSVLWQEFAQLRLEDKSPDIEAINKFIETTFRDRLIELRRIVEEVTI